MKLFAVIGNPILHSRSPQIWNHAFKGLGISAHYFRINPTNAEKAIQVIRTLPLTGCNVTTPFKRDVFAYMDEIDESARILEAVNTIKNDDGRLIGFNTDHYGVVNALKEDGVDPKGKRVVVLGAGGAARAAIYGLLNAGARDVVILNRTYEKAQKVADRLGCRAVYVARTKNEIEQADILVSCIPAKKRIVKKEWLHEKLAVFDANYATTSILLNDAQKSGCHVISGLNWLVHQAVPAFNLFFDANPTAYMQAVVNNDPTIAPTTVAFIGFMGSGKTAVGKRLARLTKTDFVDTDSLIEEHVGESIPDIFEKYGESQFRAFEKTVFKKLDFSSGKIISCGGGAVKDEEIRTLLREHALVAWLWCSIPGSIARIRKGTRPLLDTDDAEERAGRLLAERIPLYAQCADVMVINEDIMLKKVAGTIKKEMNGKLRLPFAKR